ncbi:MAG: A24 family peptidase [Woeseiaceae bacterium]|nr:A24 family peptidase [Woeseiaceae bacterium]
MPRSGAWQNVPVLSFLLLRGRCNKCRRTDFDPLSSRWILTAVLTGLVAWRFGFGWQALAGIGLILVLIAITFIDFDHQVIPDSPRCRPLSGPASCCRCFYPQGRAACPVRRSEDGDAHRCWRLPGPLERYHLFRPADRQGRHGLRRLQAAGWLLGAWLGWQQLPMIIILSALVGAVLGIALTILRGRDRNVPTPFGPFLAAACWLQPCTYRR